MTKRTQVLTCLHCSNTFERERVKGQVPKWCPDCRRLGLRERKCPGCGRIGVRPDSTHCSIGCKPSRGPIELHPNPSTLTWLPARHPAMRKPITYTQRVWVSGKCKRCGQAFVIVDQLTTNWCSKRCAKARGKARRRAAKKNAYVADVSPSQIYERDQWTCQLCNKEINRSVAVPHPQAVTLDHIIPLADGGTHEPVNCQTAHFICNSRKGDRGVDQLRLIA